MLRPVWIKDAFRRIKDNDTSDELRHLICGSLDAYIEELESTVDRLRARLTDIEMRTLQGAGYYE